MNKYNSKCNNICSWIHYVVKFCHRWDVIQYQNQTIISGIINFLLLIVRVSMLHPTNLSLVHLLIPLNALPLHRTRESQKSPICTYTRDCLTHFKRFRCWEKIKDRFVTRTPREDNSGDVVFHLDKQCFNFPTIVAHHMDIHPTIMI